LLILLAFQITVEQKMNEASKLPFQGDFIYLPLKGYDLNLPCWITFPCNFHRFVVPFVKCHAVFFFKVLQANNEWIWYFLKHVFVKKEPNFLFLTLKSSSSCILSVLFLPFLSNEIIILQKCLNLHTIFCPKISFENSRFYTRT